MPLGAFRTMLEAVATADPADLPPSPQLAGLLDDGRGGSALLAAIKSASDEQLCRARRQIQLLRTGTFESELRHAAEALPEADQQVLLLGAEWARSQRFLHRGNPLMVPVTRACRPSHSTTHLISSASPGSRRRS